jgi:hypothetical protein
LSSAQSQQRIEEEMTDNDTDKLLWRGQQLAAEMMMPFLKDEGSLVQQVALADLVAVWIAGHVMLNDEGEIDAAITKEAREMALDNFVGMVRGLIDSNTEMFIKPKLKQGVPFPEALGPRRPRSGAGRLKR